MRSEVIGNVDRKATAGEIGKMQAIVEQAMKDGAFGLSTGLFYGPGTFTPTDEVVELARALADQMREDLPLLATRQIGARRRRGQRELRRVARPEMMLITPPIA